MATKDAIARGYASANDDIRHHLIDKGWFGETTKDAAMRRDVDATIAQHDQDVGNSAWGKLPETERFNETSDDQQSEIAEFYGTGGQDREAQAGDLYGYDREEVDTSGFYGDGGSPEADRGDLYGPDIEQDRE